MRAHAALQRTNAIRPEYDFASLGPGVRGKYYRAYCEGTNVVLLALDVAKVFRNARAVNAALRTLIRASKAAVPTAR